MKKAFFGIGLIVLFVLPAVWSLLQPGFFPSHDGEWMVIRLTDFHRSFVSGQIPVRWAARLNHGYGYPVFNFLYPFSLYFGEFIYFFTGSFVNAIKLVFILSTLLSGIFMYLWIREGWGDWAGLTSAIIYTYTPYRFLDIYVRGSLGEAVAFIFPPLIFWSAGRLVKKWDKFFLIIGGLAFAGLITSHNTMAMLFALLFGGSVLFRWLLFRQNKVFWRQLAILLFGLLLSCFFWLPALHDKQYVFFDQVLVSNFFLHFPTLRQLLVPSWGYGPSLPSSDQDTLSFQVGVFNLAIFIIGLVVFGLKLFQSSKRRNYLRKNFKAFYFLLVFATSFFLMLGVSAWAWRFLLIYNLIQFPWRLLSLTTFSSAVLAGAMLSLIGGQLIRARFQLFLAMVLVFFVVLLNLQYAKPEYLIDRGENYYITNEGTTTVANEYLPIWVEEPPATRAKEKVEVLSGEGIINNLVFNSRKVSFDFETERESEIQINSHYFPGWKIRMDGTKTQIDYQNKEGIMRVKMAPGIHQVRANFGETPVRFLADLASLLGLVVVLSLVVKRK